MSTSKSICLTGWAVKQGQKVKSWKRRWFVLLSNGSLRYFQDKLSFQEKGHVNLDKSTVVSVVPASAAGIPIEIVSAKRVFVMSLPSKEEAELWTNKLRELTSTLA